MSITPRRYDLRELWSLQPERDRPRVASVTCLPITDDVGELTHVLVTVIDVTAEGLASEEAESRRIEAEEARHWFEAVVKQLPGGVILAQIPSGELLLSNNQLEEILGHPAHASAEIEDYRQWGAIHPDGTPYLPEEHPLARAVKRQEVVESEEVLYRRPDGSLRVLIASAAPIHGADGHAHTAVANFLDITDRKRAEEFREKLADAGQELVMSLDPEATIQRVVELPIPTFADACFLHLLDHGGLRQAAVAHRDPKIAARLSRAPSMYASEVDAGQLAIELLRAGEPLHVPEVTDALLQQVALDDDHLQGLRALGARSTFAVPMQGRRGALGALTLVMTDWHRVFDELARAKSREYATLAAVALENGRLFQEAQQAIRAREQVLAAVSHDLRNPLNVIDLGSRALASGEHSPRSAHKIHRAAQHMRRLIDDLLDLSSIESGTLAIVPRPEPVATILEDIVTDYELVAAEAGCHVQHSVKPTVETAKILCDHSRVRQILGNLVDNAIKHTVTGDVVLVSVTLAERDVVFSVSDRGPGIPEADQARIFDRYWHSSAAPGNRGLGLSITKALVEAHGGRIWVDSHPGAGSSFLFTMPLASGSDDTAATTTA